MRLVATDTATDHWADRFDKSVTDLAAGQEAIAQRIAVALGIQVVDAEGVRVARERPDNPDSLDLILRARSIENQPTSLPRLDRARACAEQALLLDPSSVRAMTGLSRMIFAQRSVQGYWQSGDEPKRMMKLQAAAEAVAPADQEVMEDAARRFTSAKNGLRCHQPFSASSECIRTVPSPVLTLREAASLPATPMRPFRYWRGQLSSTPAIRRYRSLPVYGTRRTTDRQL